MAAPTPFLTTLAVEDQQAERALLMRRAYLSYRGTPKKPLSVRAGEPDDNLILSLGRLIVDKGVSFLVGQEVTSQIEDVQGAKPNPRPRAPSSAPRQDWLDECWRRNKRALTLQKFATNGGICGHAFARILDTTPWPRVIVLDPQTVSVMTDPDDIDTVWRYTITPPPAIEEDGEPPVRRRTIVQAEAGIGRITRLDRAPPWSITDQVFACGAWTTTATRVWSYPFSPIVDCQNMPRPNDFWGESDLPEDLLAVLDGFNRVASHYNKIIRLHAHPKIWTKGMGARTLDVGIDSVIHLPSETAELKALEMQSDLHSTAVLFEKILTLIGMMSRIPLVAMGMPDNLGNLSGVALKIRYQPLVEKTEAKRRTYGDAIQELDRRLLALGGFGDTTITQLQWHEMLPIDPLLERQVLVLDDSLGIISKKSIADQLGYDYDAETEQMTTELAAAGAAPGTSDQVVPPPAKLTAPIPDVARKATSH